MVGRQVVLGPAPHSPIYGANNVPTNGVVITHFDASFYGSPSSTCLLAKTEHNGKRACWGFVEVANFSEWNTVSNSKEEAITRALTENSGRVEVYWFPNFNKAAEYILARGW